MNRRLSARGGSSARSVVMLCLTVAAPFGFGCGSGEKRGGPDDSCRLPRDCGEGLLCNPGSSRCVADVEVGRNEFAGTFRLMVAPGGAVTNQNMYAKANLAGAEYEMFQRTVFESGADEQRLELRNAFDASAEVVLAVSIPAALAAVGREIRLSDGLAAEEGTVGDGFLYLEQPGNPANADDDVIRLLGQVESGSFMFSELATASGGGVSGELRGTLMPPTYQHALSRTFCPEGQLLDPNTLDCIPTFGGYDLLVGITSVFDGTRGKGGEIVSSYRIEDEVQIYSGGSSWSYERGSDVVIEGSWLTIPGEEVRLIQIVFPRTRLEGVSSLVIGKDATVSLSAGERQPDGSLEFGQVLWSIASGELNVRHFRSGAGGRLQVGLWGTASGGPAGLLEGENCRVSNDLCLAPLVCFPVATANDGWCSPPCVTDQECLSPDRCMEVQFFGGEKKAVCGATLDDFRVGCAGREAKFCEAGSHCVRNDSEPSPNSVCLPGCDPAEVGSCDDGQECWELADPSFGGCYRVIGRRGQCPGSLRSQGYLCAHSDRCVVLGEAPNTRSICLTRCAPAGGGGCAADERCQPLPDPAQGACLRVLERGARCGGEITLGGDVCAEADLCVTHKDGLGYCRQDCTSDQSSCTGGFACTSLTNGKWACLPPPG